MGKLWKRILTLALIAVMFCTLLGVSASALGTDEYRGRNYRRYAYIGDSISWGYGLDPTVDPLAANNTFIRIKDSYTDIVGRVLEESCGTLVLPAENSGGRFCEYRVALEHGMGVENPYTYGDDWFGNRAPERTHLLMNSGVEVCAKIKDADLVTIQLGINDIAGALVNALSASGWIDMGKLTAIKDVGGVFAYVSTALTKAGNPIRIPEKVLTALNEQLALMHENTRKVLDDIVELSADDADILVIGYHDPASRLRLVPGTDYSLLLNIFGLAIQNLNDYLANLTLEYDNVYFVSILGASSFYNEGDSIFDILGDEGGMAMAIHPDIAGHAFIASRVIEKLNEIHICRHEHTKTVTPRCQGMCGCRYTGVLVCADCGKLLDAGKIVTHCVEVPIPEISMYYINKTAENVITAKANRLSSRISSLFR